MKIFLWGMPGSGKSTVGQELAQLLNLPFYDLDYLIERHTGRTPAKWIEEDGEEDFRKQEHIILIEWNPINGLLACGGGTPCFYKQEEWMNQQGITFWLNPSIDLLLSQLAQSAENRPLLKSVNRSAVQDLMEQRQHHFAQARFTLEWVEETAPKKLAQRMVNEMQSAGLGLPSQ